MGTRVTDAGVSVQPVNHDGTPAGEPIWGRHAKLLGKLRETILKEKAATQDEGNSLGSEHWLTLVAVADTKARMDALVADSKLEDTGQQPQTSMSSHRALVEVHVGEVRQSFQQRTVIASGPVVSFPPNKPNIHVVHVKVLPEGTVMDENHILYEEFKGGAIAII